MDSQRGYPQGQGANSRESLERNQGEGQAVLMELAHWGEVWDEPARSR